jgi:hypothetical protein
LVTGNADVHLKNWSLLYPDRRTPVLSPAYDLVSTLPYLPSDTLGLNFGNSRDLHEITKDQIRRFAEAARIPVSPLWKVWRRLNGHESESWIQPRRTWSRRLPYSGGQVSIVRWNPKGMRRSAGCNRWGPSPR